MVHLKLAFIDVATGEKVFAYSFHSIVCPVTFVLISVSKPISPLPGLGAHQPVTGVTISVREYHLPNPRLAPVLEAAFIDVSGVPPLQLPGTMVQPPHRELAFVHVLVRPNHDALSCCSLVILPVALKHGAISENHLPGPFLLPPNEMPFEQVPAATGKFAIPFKQAHFQRSDVGASIIEAHRTSPVLHPVSELPIKHRVIGIPDMPVPIKSPILELTRISVSIFASLISAMSFENSELGCLALVDTAITVA
mmetsp:Transcript_13468/g.16037  ORF Transcript_13468/g.16037 Transcript_13468/m.16037 type:complete len:252 (+) Transcript_13468:307-1062(+)